MSGDLEGLSNHGYSDFRKPALAAIYEFDMKPVFTIFDEGEFGASVERFLKAGFVGLAVTFPSDDFI